MPQNQTRSMPALDPIEFPGEYHSLLHRLRRVADVQPDALALTAPQGTFTFRELLDRIDVVATWVRDRVPAGDEPVGLLLSHDADAVVLLFALMRLDRVFINLDPAAPPARTADIVELAGMRACITDAAHADVLAGFETGVERVMLDVPADARAADLPMPEAADQDTAFVVFTSGSTGKPKGVIETHAQMLNDTFTNRLTNGTGPGDRVSLLFPMAFVGGPVVVFTTLLNGASLHMHDARSSTPRAILDWVRAERVTVLGMSPHLLRALTNELAAGESIDGVRVLSTGGEGISGQDVEAFRSRLAGPVIFVNGMGSSEATCTASLVIPANVRAPNGTLPAGQVLANREVRILRDDDTEAEPGETGRLLVVSDYLSGGYWRNDEENAKKFGVLPDGRRTYLQGDLARLDEDGVLTLVGRSDTAVKVRGYLVDLSEIEDALRGNEKVTEALVLPVVEPDRPTRLVAYVVQRPSVRPDSVAELRRQLRARLTEYMVPGSIVLLAEMPRNERGKIDRQRLPKPDEAEVSDLAYTQHELVVGGIWAGVLGMDKVPLDGDFLALGGDSLSVEEMLADVGERFHIELSSADLLNAPTLREFAAVVARGSARQGDHPDAVRLRTGSGERRLFCFAGAGALALQFLPLARHLDGWDVVAFQAHGLERRAVPDWSIAAHARRALRTIREQQPHGPYRLVGHSFGGMVALEVAHRLRAEGEEVALLGMIDTYLPAHAMDELGMTEQFGRLADRPSTTVLGRAMSKMLSDVGEQSLQRTTPLRATVRLLRARTAGIIRYSGQQQFDTFFYQSVLAARGYQAQPYDGRAMVVAGLGNPNDEAEWGELLTGDVRFVTVDGEHSAMMREPHVGAVAAALLEQLESPIATAVPSSAPGAIRG
ncbi:AMP-binding protein [Amnibacterium sp.]|uniref:AMP-binding protein n=1 Tax=Amnibacterium sp. TaxID=1872496 RepID=UPI003F7B4CF7